MSTAAAAATMSSMSTFDPSDPFPKDRPRSSPIPGVSEPGNAGPFPSASFGVPQGQPGVGQSPFGQTPAPGGPTMWTPTVTITRRSGWVTLIAVLLPILLTTGIIVYVMHEVRGAVDNATSTLDDAFETTSGNGTTEGLGLDVDATTLFDPAAAPAVIADIDAELSGEPTEFVKIVLYDTYALVDARDAAQPTHIDEYDWRGGELSGARPQSNIDDLESVLFTADKIDWAAIGSAAVQAPAAVEVEEGEVSHVYVERGTNNNGKSAIVVRIYVSGPRSSAWLELDRNGKVLAVH